MGSLGGFLDLESSDLDMKLSSTPQLFVNGFHCSDDDFGTIYIPHRSSIDEVELLPPTWSRVQHQLRYSASSCSDINRQKIIKVSRRPRTLKGLVPITKTGKTLSPRSQREETTPATSPSRLQPYTRRKSSSKMQCGYRDLQTAPEQDIIKQHILSTFQLAKLITEFINKFASVYETFARELQTLAMTYKQKSSEYTRSIEGTQYEQNSLKLAWDTLLQEVLTDAENYADFAVKSNKAGYSRLLELTTCKKLHMKEMFNFRQNMDAMVDKSEESLHKLRVELRQENHSFDIHRHHFTVGNNDRKDKAFVHCVEAHNEYILELKGTNKLIDEYHNTGLPWLLDQLESVHKDTCNGINSSLQNLALINASRARDQAHRYDGVFSVCKQANIVNDIQNFVKLVRPKGSEVIDDAIGTPRHHVFKPVLDHPSTPQCLMKGEMIFEKVAESSLKHKRHCLSKESMELKRYIQELEDSSLSLQETQQRLLSSNNFNKVYDIQSDLCRQKKDMHMAKLRLSVIQCQIDAVSQNKGGSQSGSVEAVSAETASTKSAHKNSTIKAMWKKFAKRAAKKKEDQQEENTELDPVKNDPPRQPSRDDSDEAVSVEPAKGDQIDASADPVYNLLKNASTLSRRSTGNALTTQLSVGGADGDSSGVSSMRSLPRQATTSSGKSGSSRSSSPATRPSSSSSTRPRQMLNKRMKSFSLDTPDAPRHMDVTTKAKSSSFSNNTFIPGSSLSPAHIKRKLHQHRGLSVDLDEQPYLSYDNSNNSLHSTHSNSPRHSRNSYINQTPNESNNNGDVYVAVYDFTAKEQGDLSLRAGERVVVKDTGDPEWWIGSVDGYTGYFPHRYVLPIAAGQRIYQIVKPLHLGQGNNEVKLLRDQVVVETGAEELGVVNIQTNDIKTGQMYHIACPVRYLHEI